MKRLVSIAVVLLLSSSITFAQDFCQGDFNFNGSVGAEDVTIFLSHFGRSQFNNPCPPDGPTPVTKTGQTTSYATGDDGDLEKGLVWPNPRFTDNGDGTVTDNQTGLIWMKEARCFGTRTWDNALTDCNGLADGQCGLSDGSQAGDWRLSNINELASLVHRGYHEPAVPDTAGTGQWSQGDPFNNVHPTSAYWSSTTVTGYNVDGWNVYMNRGYAYANNKGMQFYVWPVRGGH